jgi:hypothetical protein
MAQSPVHLPFIKVFAMGWRRKTGKLGHFNGVSAAALLHKGEAYYLGPLSWPLPLSPCSLSSEIRFMRSKAVSFFLPFLTTTRAELSADLRLYAPLSPLLLP